MPFYTYQVIHEDGTEGEIFEIERSMTDPPVTRHPETGERVRRVYQPPNIGGAWSEQGESTRLGDKNIERHGFTKYVKTGKGQYERTAGSSGPDQFSAG